MADWKQGEIDTARHLWRDGEKASRIGRRLDRSKNSVISAAHRYGFGKHPYGHDPRLAA